MVNLIVLSGDAGAGKDSVAKILVERHGWKLFSLAAPLKRFGADMFGFTDEQLYGPSSARNRPDPRWARPCSSCGGDGFASAVQIDPCMECGGAGKVNDNSPRRVLQLLGEEFLRQMIHVDALTIRARPEIQRMLAAGDRVVVNDARNDNDRDNLHAWLNAARVDVRSSRTHEIKEGQEWRLHLSEQRKAADDRLEHIIDNDEEWPFPSLDAQVSRMLLALEAAR